MTLPILDMSLFLHGDEKERRQFAAELHAAVSVQSFVKLRNHGLPKEDVSRMFQLSRLFFGLPDSIKTTIAHPGGAEPQRGWGRMGGENSAAFHRSGVSGDGHVLADLRDAKEHFDQGLATDTRFPNRWVEEKAVPGFREFMEATFVSMEQVCDSILEALELALNLPPGSFRDRCTHKNNASEFRLNYYPPISVDTLRGGKVSRIWPHFDVGLVTLLFQDGAGGLEFEDRRHPGQYIAAGCEHHSDLILNLCETMQRWTNDTLRAGLHRVTFPPGFELQAGDSMLPDRYSAAYFCRADRSIPLAPMTQFVRNGDEGVHDNITADEYHRRRIGTAYNNNNNNNISV